MPKLPVLLNDFVLVNAIMPLIDIECVGLTSCLLLELRVPPNQDLTPNPPFHQFQLLVRISLFIVNVIVHYMIRRISVPLSDG